VGWSAISRRGQSWGLELFLQAFYPSSASPWKIFLSNTVNIFWFFQLHRVAPLFPRTPTTNNTTSIVTIGLWYNENILCIHSWLVDGLPRMSAIPGLTLSPNKMEGMVITWIRIFETTGYISGRVAQSACAWHSAASVQVHAFMLHHY
jgi:hypothetical protein